MRIPSTMCLLLPLALLLAPGANADEGLGDIFVSVASGGGLIFLDGATTGTVAPGVVRGVSPGVHTIRVDDGCKTATADVTVRVNAVERVTMALGPGTGTVKVASTPPEAEVTENGSVLGAGSFGPLVFSCGSHTLVATAPGRQTVTYTVEVPLRGHADVRLDLPAAAIGSIAITPSPFGAEVFVDGATKGFGPITVDGLLAGVHTVSARLDGYIPAEQEVTVVAYQIVRSTIDLTARPLPVPLGKRLGFDRIRWGRVGVDLGVSVAAVGLGAVAFLQYDRAVDNYGTYSTLTYADDPGAYYASEVAAPRAMAYVLTGASGATAITSGILWATTKPKPAAVTTGTSTVPAAAAPAAPAPAWDPSAPPTPAHWGPSAPPPPATPPTTTPPSGGSRGSLELRVVPSLLAVVVAGRF